MVFGLPTGAHSCTPFLSHSPHPPKYHLLPPLPGSLPPHLESVSLGYFNQQCFSQQQYPGLGTLGILFVQHFCCFCYLIIVPPFFFLLRKKVRPRKVTAVVFNSKIPETLFKKSTQLFSIIIKRKKR